MSLNRLTLTLALAALTVAASASDPAIEANVLDPFPSLRSVGDTVYTKFSAILTNVTGNGTKAAVSGACVCWFWGGGGRRCARAPARHHPARPAQGVHPPRQERWQEQGQRQLDDRGG